MSIEDNLKQLTDVELKILKMKCSGLNYLQIAGKLGYQEVTVQYYMSGIYRKFGFRKEMHWRQRTEILKNQICPLIDKVTTMEVVDGEIVEEPKTEPRPDPEMFAIVKLDQQKEEEEKVEQEKRIIKLPPAPLVGKRRVGPSLISLALIGLCCMGMVALSVLGWRFYPLAVAYLTQQAPQTVIITATPDHPPTLTRVANPVAPLIPTDTPLPPTLTPTVTIEPTITATKAFYDQGEWMPMGDGVYARMNENFGSCSARENEFSVQIDFHNDGREQYTLRYDASAFHAVDDTGHEYKLVNMGLRLCNEVGVQNHIILGDDVTVGIKFAGTFPLEAKYLTITADSVNGVKLVFRKKI